MHQKENMRNKSYNGFNRCLFIRNPVQQCFTDCSLVLSKGKLMVRLHKLTKKPKTQAIPQVTALNFSDKKDSKC